MSGMVLRHVIESTAICLLLEAFAICLRSERAAFRHILWLLGVLKFLIPSVLLAPLGARIASVLPAAPWMLSFAVQLSRALSGLFRLWPAKIAFGRIASTSLVIGVFWISGSALAFAHWYKRLRKARVQLSAASQPEQSALDRVQSQFGFLPTVRLCSSDRLREPALLGIRHPVITIPRGLSQQLTPHELDAVLLHELAHACRLDNLAATFVRIVVCMFWFHPLLWFAERRMLVEREQACDEAVLHRGVESALYAAALAKVCRFHVFSPVAGVSGMGASDLGVRFRNILSYSGSTGHSYPARLLLAALTLAVTLLPLAGGYCQQCVSNGRGSPDHSSAPSIMRQD